jgi:hypothetical protein
LPEEGPHQLRWTATIPGHVSVESTRTKDWDTINWRKPLILSQVVPQCRVCRIAAPDLAKKYPYPHPHQFLLHDERSRDSGEVICHDCFDTSGAIPHPV